MEKLPYILNTFPGQAVGAMPGLTLWQAEGPVWIRVAFLVALVVTLILYMVVIKPPPPRIGQALGTLLVLGGGLATAILFFVLLFRLNPLPVVRSTAEIMGLQQLVNFDTAFAHGLPDAISANIGVVSVERVDTDDDGFNEWVVFYKFDSRNVNSPIHGAIYDNDRGNPPVIFPYLLRAPDRNYLSDQQVFGPVVTIQELARDLTPTANNPGGTDVPEIIIQGARELTIFRFDGSNNSLPWDPPRDSPARYQPIGFFRGSGGVKIDLDSGSSRFGQVTVIDRDGYERSQLAVRSVYGLITDSAGNQTYLSTIPPLGGVGGPALAAPLLSTVDFDPAPPDELFNTPFPEKIVLGFHAATCGSTSDDTLCNANNTASRLLWREASLGNFLSDTALNEFNANNPNYFSLPSFSGNTAISVAQLCYYPQLETDPDFDLTGGGRDEITGEKGQEGLVDMAFTINGSALQTARYQMRLVQGQWKIMSRLEAPQFPCASPDTPGERSTETDPPPVDPPPPPPQIPPVAGPNGPYTGLVCQNVEFSANTSTDPDGGSIVDYRWDFGDGAVVNTPGPTISHTYAAPGSYTVTLLVTDDDNQPSSPVTTTATISLPAPPPSGCDPSPCCE